MFEADYQLQFIFEGEINNRTNIHQNRTERLLSKNLFILKKAQLYLIDFVDYFRIEASKLNKRFILDEMEVQLEKEEKLIKYVEK